MVAFLQGVEIRTTTTVCVCHTSSSRCLTIASACSPPIPPILASLADKVHRLSAVDHMDNRVFADCGERWVLGVAACGRQWPAATQVDSWRDTHLRLLLLACPNRDVVWNVCRPSSRPVHGQRGACAPLRVPAATVTTAATASANDGTTTCMLLDRVPSLTLQP